MIYKRVIPFLLKLRTCAVTVCLNIAFSADLEVYEVEEFLADVLNHEFDTIADDGSLTEVQYNDLVR